MDCPLTVWEDWLSGLMAGQKSYSRDFLAYRALRPMFFSGPTWVVTLAQCVFGGAVLSRLCVRPAAAGGVGLKEALLRLIHSAFAAGRPALVNVQLHHEPFLAVGTDREIA